MKLFSIAGFEFCICFAVTPDKYSDLINLAYEWHVDLSEVSSDDEYTLMVIDEVCGNSNVEVYSESDLVTGFLKGLKEDGGWIQDRGVVNEQPMLIFYRKELLQ